MLYKKILKTCNIISQSVLTLFVIISLIISHIYIYHLYIYIYLSLLAISNLCHLYSFVSLFLSPPFFFIYLSLSYTYIFLIYDIFFVHLSILSISLTYYLCIKLYPVSIYINFTLFLLINYSFN